MVNESPKSSGLYGGKAQRLSSLSLCNPVGDLRYDSFFLFHGNLRFPVAKLTVDELRGAPPPPPLLGVCVAPDLPVVQEIYGNVQTQFARAQFVLWRVDAK